MAFSCFNRSENCDYTHKNTTKQNKHTTKSLNHKHESIQTYAHATKEVRQSKNQNTHSIERQKDYEKIIGVFVCVSECERE